MGLGILYAYRGMIAAEFADGIGFGGFAMGIAVFILWVIVVPADPEGDVEFAETLFAAPPLAVIAWITMRIIGSSIVVPVVEELAFRAGLPILLRGWLGPLVGPQPAAIAAFAASSVAFGILHSDILAGTLAGACYGLLTLRTGRVGDAIVAHAVTNFLICIAVLGTDRWSLW
jgi:CAAX prenyl protease-like protein